MPDIIYSKEGIFVQHLRSTHTSLDVVNQMLCCVFYMLCYINRNFIVSVISKARRCPWLRSTSKTQRSAMFSVTITTLRWTTLCTPPSPRGRKRTRGGRRRGWPKQTSAHQATSSESTRALVGWGSVQVMDKHGSLCTWTSLYGSFKTFHCIFDLS